MTANALLTPRSKRRSVSLGRRMWRTQLLPLGEITYKGQKLKFDKPYLLDLVQSFKDGAFDQVPFQLANDRNKHNNDPERTRGKIVDVELASDGLDLILEATEKGDELLRDNPGLGVSARIYEDYTRSDGKHWKAALQHVLGTLDPHIAGMRGWQEVEVPVALSNEIGDVEVLDLSDVTFGEREGGDKVAKFTDADKGQLLELLKKARNASDDDLEGLVDELTEDDEDGEDGDESELSDEDLDRLIAEAEQDGPDDEDEDESEEEEEEVTDRVPATVSASQRRQAIELANANALIAQQGEHLEAVQARLDDEAFANERTVFANTFGIPPTIVDLARPLLEGAGHVIELSGGDEIDAGQVMRAVLTELGKQIKLLDLSSVIGNGLEPDEEREEREQSVQETRDFVQAARKAFAL